MTDALIDYAQHLMRIETMARDCHDHCLAKSYEQAAEVALQIRAEARLLELTLREMAAQEARLEDRLRRIRERT